MKRVLLILGLVLTVVAATGTITWVAWKQRVRQHTYLTDARTIQEPIDEAQARDVLWSSAMREPGKINSAASESEPAFLADGSLLFARSAPGSVADIFIALPTVDGWSEPTPFEPLRSRFDDLGPAPTRDGRAIYFYSNRPGGEGGFDLWVVDRTPSGWSPAQNLGPAINTRFDEIAPTASGDGRHLFFASNRPTPGDTRERDLSRAYPRGASETPDYDIYGATFDTPDGMATPVDAINTPFDETSPALAPFDDFLYFASNRPGGAGGFDLFRVRWLDHAFGQVESLGDAVNSQDDEFDPALDQSGFRLFFASDRTEERSGGTDSFDDDDLYAASSREVFREIASFQWRVLWREITPSLLWVLAAIVLIIIFIVVLRRLEYRRLGLLARCLLVSLLVHMMMMFLLSVWGVTTSIQKVLTDRPGIRVAITSPNAEDAVTAQIRGEITSVSIDAFDNPMEDAPRRTPAPELAGDSPAIMTPGELRTFTSPASPAHYFVSEARAAPPSSDAPARRTPSFVQTSTTSSPIETDQPLNIPGAPRTREINEPTLAQPQPISTSENRAIVRHARPNLFPAEPASPLNASVSPDSTSANTPVPRQHFVQNVDAQTRDTPPAARARATASQPTDNTIDSAPLAFDEQLTLDATMERIRHHEPTTDIHSVPTEPSNQMRPTVGPTMTNIDVDRSLRETNAPAAAEPPLDQSAPLVGTTGAINDAIVQRKHRRSIEPNEQQNLALAHEPADTIALPESTLERGTPSTEAEPAFRITPSPDATNDPPVRRPGFRGLDLPLPDTLRATEHAGTPLAHGLTPAESSVSSLASDASKAPREADPRNTGATSADPPHSSNKRPADLAMTDLSQASIDPSLTSLQRLQSDLPGETAPETTLAIHATLLPDAQRASLRDHNMLRLEPPPSRPMHAPINRLIADDPLSQTSMASANDALVPDVTLPKRAPTLRERMPGTRSSPPASTTPAIGSIGLPSARAHTNNPFEQRHEAQRSQLLHQRGGDARTEHAVALALSWLAKHQSDEGRWDGDGFDPTAKCGGTTNANVDVAITGLSTLAFLGADHVHTRTSTYQQNVRKAIEWLLTQQRSDGGFLGNEHTETLYSHGIATIAVAEAYAMTGDPQLIDPLLDAIEFIDHAANDELGGWRYAPGQIGDTSVTGWQVMAMAAAARCGVEIPQSALRSASTWLDRVRHPRLAGRYAYQPGKQYTEAMTAEAMFMRQLLGAERSDNDLNASATYLLDHLPDWKLNPNTYYWYYGTLAMYHYQGAGWEIWNRAVKRELIENQRTDGCARGSWDPNDQWAEVGGRVYQTAIAALTLEIYYRYDPIFSPRDEIDPIGTIEGRVVDVLSGQPIGGALVMLDLPGRAPITNRTDTEGRYKIAAPAMADFFAISASHPDYAPQTATASADELRSGRIVRHFRLNPTREDIIAVETVPTVHHLGNDLFEGRINSQFQRESEGVRFRTTLTVLRRQLPPVFNRAEIRMLAKGVQARNHIRINGRLLQHRLNRAPSDGSYGEIIIPFDIALLNEGVNDLLIEARNDSGDIDDFEFVNIQIYLHRR